MASANASIAAVATTALVGTAFVLGPSTAVSTSSSSSSSSGLRGSAASQRPVSSTEFALSISGVGFLGLGAGAAALLAGTQQARGRNTQKSVVTVCAFENELGVQAPVGFWDPAKFTADGDAELFARRRGVELKHGRIAMLAAMGYITPELTGKFPGYLSPSNGLQYEDIPNGLAAISKVPSLGWAQIFGYCAFCETSKDQSKGAPGEVGDFGFKVLTSSDPEAKKKKLAAEIANGRLAMMATIGMFFQDGLTGSAWGDWANYTASPLRAFENELGVQAPLGFWDPAGFTADGDVYSFKRRRSVEIKHGRICMLATMGYITPEITGKFGGYLSPSEKLAFSDIPNGLAALGKVPFLGWIQMAGYAGFTEIQARYDADINERNEPGNMGWKPPLLSTDDPETRTRRLNAEIANGRLAMMAIMGMFFQDGLTGSAWGDWANYTASPLRAQ